MVVAVLNYAFHPVMSRLLSVRDFGDVQAAFSLATQMTTVIGAFTLATVHASVNADESGSAQAVVKLLRRAALAIVGVFIIGLLLGARELTKNFQFASPTLLFALAAFLVSSVLYSVRVGFLQGKAKFFHVSAASILVSGGRLAFAALFVWLGWRAFGAMAGFVAAQLVSLALVTFWTRDHLRASGTDVRTLTRKEMLKELGFVVFIGCVTVFITALYTSDVLLVKRLFTPDEAGIYSGISTVAKITIFATGPFSAVLLSAVKRKGTVADRKPVFLKALGLVAAAGGSACLAFLVAPAFFTRLLIGERYVSSAFLLPWLAGAFFLVSIANVCCNLGIALRRKRLLFVVISGSVSLILLVLWQHGSLLEIAHAFFGAALVSSLGGLAFALQELRDRRPLST